MNVWLWYYDLKNVWYDKLWNRNKVIHLRLNEWKGMHGRN